jgi:hypothetical protein
MAIETTREVSDEEASFDARDLTVGHPGEVLGIGAVQVSPRHSRPLLAA